MPIDPDIYQGLSDGAKIIIILIIVGLPVLGTITVVLIQSLATKVKQIDAKTDTIQRQSKKTVDQVVNDHTMNLRDDLDEKIGGLDEKIGGLDEKIDRIISIGSQQVLAAQQADRAQGERMNTLVERVNDMSTRIRRLEGFHHHEEKKP